MFSRFTEKAIQAIMLAQEEAKRFHHSYVGTEHILLGIIGAGGRQLLSKYKHVFLIQLIVLLLPWFLHIQDHHSHLLLQFFDYFNIL